MEQSSNATPVPDRDAGEQVFTQSLDGFLVGGHPELGDIAFADDGSELGRVAFFYDRVDPTRYRVQVEGQTEDPLLVVVTAIVDRASGTVVGHRLIGHPGAAKGIPDAFGAGVNVVRSDNA